MCGSIPCFCKAFCVLPGPQKCVIDFTHGLSDSARSNADPLLQKKYCLPRRSGASVFGISRYVASALMPFSLGASACVSLVQFTTLPTSVSIRGSSCSPSPSAEPFTQIPRLASFSHDFDPAVQTSCESEIAASSGTASALATHSGEFGIVAGIDSRLNQYAPAG